MIVWISKYALSSGITKHDAKIDDKRAVRGDPFSPCVYFKLGRDELLHALQGLLDALPSATTHPAIKSARAAIARATGEQP